MKGVYSKNNKKYCFQKMKSYGQQKIFSFFQKWQDFYFKFKIKKLKNIDLLLKKKM